MNDDLSDVGLGLPDVAAARLGAFLDNVRTFLPHIEWFSFSRPDGKESSRMYLQDLMVLLKLRDDMEVVHSEAMALLSELEVGLVDRVAALEVFRSDDGVSWVKAQDLHAAMSMVADRTEEQR